MPTKEYYRKLKKEAHDLFVTGGLTVREISERTGVSEKSISTWVNANEAAWRKEQQAAAVSTQKQGDNLKEIINILSKQKLALLHDIEDAERTGDTERVLDLRKQASTLDNSVAQWGKQLSEMNKDNRITLSIYLEVMDKIFEALRLADPALYYKTLDFQENHVYDITKLLG